MDAHNEPDARLTAARGRMLALLRNHVRNEAVLEAFAAVPRERFVLPADTPAAYDDRPLPIGFSQTISQPLMVALILDAARIRPGDRALEVGTGSGYEAAVLSLLAGDVVTVELVPELTQRASKTLRELGYRVEVHQADDVLGWPDRAPFDVIIVAAGAPAVPDALVRQLADGGRMIIPTGGRWSQTLTLVTKRGSAIKTEYLGTCAFVPLLGTEAWPADRSGSVSAQ